MAELMADVPGSALAVFAHPDDPEVACGGTLARWSAAGAEVRVVICGSGDKGSLDPATDRSALVVTRAAEVASAAEHLGLAGHHLLGHPDGELDAGPELRGELVGLIRRFRPEVVICPDPTAVFFGQHYVNHFDHRNVGWATLDAVAPCAGMPLYFPEAGPPHQVAWLLLSGTLDPDVWVDITSSIERKATAVACHASQLAGGPDGPDGPAGPAGEQAVIAMVRQRAEEAGRAAGVRYAEGYRRIRVG
ncbi:MAG TPA: PIG-L deacetylase family protein [Acidimicrobiales bacterium]